MKDILHSTESGSSSKGADFSVNPNSTHFTGTQGSALELQIVLHSVPFCMELRLLQAKLKAYLSKEGLEVPPQIASFFPTHETSLLTSVQLSCPCSTGLQDLPKSPQRNGWQIPGLRRDSNRGP